MPRKTSIALECSMGIAKTALYKPVNTSQSLPTRCKNSGWECPCRSQSAGASFGIELIARGGGCDAIHISTG
jgi:hypothetical protein